MTLHVIRPGLSSTFQDLGRSGFQHLGVPANGAMDSDAHTLANVLVGNTAAEATLEVLLQGPTLRFQVGTVIALAGADLGAQLDGHPLPPLRAVRVRPGAVLAFGRRRWGARAYLAVRGGYLLTPTLGSLSTNSRAGYGGYAGRALQAGDVISICSSFANPPRVDASGWEGQGGNAPIRVMPGREWHLFSTSARQQLQGSAYRIGNDSERMGYRLCGQALALHNPVDLLSEAVSFGTVQVPPNGQPIVLMADRQTTGGYPRIAQVISVDLPRLAQKLPGDTLHFSLVDIDQAQHLSQAREARFARLASHSLLGSHRP
ncbi:MULTISPECIES: biotin-dependent carboxyltransferase family protein [unclassified Pseudomonas]|uniref:5-oxoprolinase subunit C family protein n=1 Tax=unclassified Pseudomonas TaxID=196821 RepID=UPI000BCF02D0|nr:MULTISPECIES: biotin-dependent carboxyltransferase family protein [unclassified Pseudomonas]PVZ12488.1 biotin-dependent carboxylase-like uncharacterized protein [Pseudomonas sp. URIL14HWK12:I12]PVZ23360.1 biotin-dependent carboxylase-like uncharacterized protein [Pseudomonas sp. URIL14HWK12:I10]PVZ32690.1 biotin-dependent carboxylase-like uncharacterized protein [Pseudomonas sp. URIL14HWK12:I11]SNZ13844.1 biotin-dependent carboxylase uncharacterized domain-containing protein [Pseudomonas sp.